MLITVQRTDKSSDGIFGNLSIDSDPFKCITEENLATAILAGVYDVTFMWSDHFGQIMPHILVPNRTAVEVHWANYPNQLEGCLALGTTEDMKDDAILESKDAWIGFVKTITDQPALKIKFVDDFGFIA